jgi:hypothetical protein
MMNESRHNCSVPGIVLKTESKELIPLLEAAPLVVERRRNLQPVVHHDEFTRRS